MKRLRGWVSENRRQVIAGTVMVLCIAAMFRFGHDREIRPILMGVFTGASLLLHRRWWVPVVAFPFIFVVGVYVSIGYVVENEFISAEPLRVSPELDVQVVPGGEFVCLHPTDEKGHGMIVCFYMPGDGLCVAAAHSCEMKSGDKLSVCPASDDGVAVLEEAISVRVDSEYGVVLEGLRCPETDRKKLPLGGARNVKVGNEAVIRTSKAGDMRVTVMGFCMIREDHFLVVRPHDKRARIGRGYSGSPVIQDGRIIAFMAAHSTLPGPTYAIARPALEVYEALQTYLEEP